MEICSRALSFWTYQVLREREREEGGGGGEGVCLLQSHQERAYQEYCASKAMEKAQEQESFYRQSMAVHTNEISSIPTPPPTHTHTLFSLSLSLTHSSSFLSNSHIQLSRHTYQVRF